MAASSTQLPPDYDIPCKVFSALPIHVAAFHNKQADIAMILDQDRTQLDVGCELGFTPLTCAIMGGHDELVQWLIDLGTQSVNTATTEGLTPMHFAARHGRVHIMAMLMKAGCTTLNAMDARGCTPMHLAMTSQSVNVVRFIARRSPESLTPKTFHGLLPLHAACDYACPKAVRVLLKYGPASMIDDNDNATRETALHVAARRAASSKGADSLGHLRCVQLLVRAGSKGAAMTDVLGLRPIVYAMRTNHAMLIGVLIVACPEDMTLLMNAQHKQA